MVDEFFAERVRAWLRSWDTGLSSEAIFHFMTLGVKGGPTPRDTADLARCLRLLDRFPEWKPRMPEMAAVSEEWAKLVPHWDRLTALFAEEAGEAVKDKWGSWSAPRTYEAMKALDL